MERRFDEAAGPGNTRTASEGFQASDYISNPVEEFKNAIPAAGLEPPKSIEPGIWYRFPGHGKKPSNKAAWCKLFEDRRGGVFGDYSTGMNETWQAARENPLTPAEQDELKRQYEAARREREDEQRKQYERAACNAESILSTAETDASNHPYMLQKSVDFGSGVKRGRWPQRDWPDALLFPLVDETGKLWSIQAINTDGKKDFLRNGRKTGCFHAIGEIQGAKRILVGEGCATVAAASNATGFACVAAMDAGNLKPVALAVCRTLPDAEIVLIADNDTNAENDRNPGLEAATDAARSVDGLVAVPEMKGRKCDFWDLWNESGAEAVRLAIESAKRLADAIEENQSNATTVEMPLRIDESIPLKKKAHVSNGHRYCEVAQGETGEQGENSGNFGPTGGRIAGERDANFPAADVFKALNYPIEALGPLAEAASAIAEGAQMEQAMAAQCVLSCAALVVQHRFNVQTLTGVKPLSLYLLTIGESGDGKTTAESAALHAIRESQKQSSSVYQAKLVQWEKGNSKAKDNEQKPREPYVLVRDGTVEGIRRSFHEGTPSQGLFTSEAAILLSGWGMNADNRAKTASTFNQLWDDGEISVTRGGSGRLQLYDRRLCVHWLVQPDAATATIHNLLLSSIGFWPRFLVAWPVPNKPKTFAPFSPERNSHIVAYWKRCEDLLDLHGKEDCGDLPVLTAEDDALKFIGKFFERMESASKTTGGLLEPIKPFGLRATEQLYRVAGVLAAFEGQAVITLDTAKNAAELVVYSLETWRTIYGVREETALQNEALHLLRWLERQPDKRAHENAILRIGPKRLRSKHGRDAALAYLEQANLATRAPNRYWIANGK